MQTIPIFPPDALVERLSDGLIDSNQGVTFLVGSAVSAPTSDGGLGIPFSNQIVEIIAEKYFSNNLALFKADIAKSANRYQAAFNYLISRRGPNAANEVIRDSVWRARLQKPTLTEMPTYKPSDQMVQDSYASIDFDVESWHLSPALQEIGKLVANYPSRFGQSVLTTNFDPLIEVAIRKAGGRAIRTALHADGNFAQSLGGGCNVVHLHGYWWGTDTLHTAWQLSQDRPRLKASLGHLLRNQILLVCGYGGWDDIINQSLADLAVDDNASPEILWAIHNEDTSSIPEAVLPLVGRGRLSVYSLVDCNSLFPSISGRLADIDPVPPPIVPSHRVSHQNINTPLLTDDLPSYSNKNKGRSLLPPEEDDNPPSVEIYVGREEQLSILDTNIFTCVAITGIGGQGKTALAGKYFRHSINNDTYDYCVWRDCKEESERFENQLTKIITALSGGAVTNKDLSDLKANEIIDAFFRSLSTRKILFVFDNIDHYIDLEIQELIGAPRQLVDEAIKRRSNSHFIFTCRSQVADSRDEFLSIRLSGLSLEATHKLFQERKASAAVEDIVNAHTLTRGHAFWLDLLAAQVAKRPEVRLADLLHPISGTSSEIPIETLQSIWSTLRDRERLVLRTLAETVRPSTEAELARFLEKELRFNKLTKALSYLRGLNLLVIKPSRDSKDGIELHPVVREFIRRTFPRSERKTFIDYIIIAYEGLFNIKSGNGYQIRSIRDLQTWTELVELYVEADKIDMALSLLHEIHTSSAYSKDPREYVRVSSLLFSKLNWSEIKKYKSLDAVVRFTVEELANLGRMSDAQRILAHYRETIKNKNVRYINYCDAYCYLEWTENNFSEAIRWGREGKELKDKSGTDTEFDTNHNLSLAQRDSGDVDQALSFFLRGRKIEDVIDPEEFDDSVGGHYYGNVGRCLQIMGQIDTALICYRKSAALLERTENSEPLTSRAYIRQWIGELLDVKGELIAAARFLKAALRIWNLTSPIREERLNVAINAQPELRESVDSIDSSDAERFCVAWIFERQSDFVPDDLPNASTSVARNVDGEESPN